MFNKYKGSIINRSLNRIDSFSIRKVDQSPKPVYLSFGPKLIYLFKGRAEIRSSKASDLKMLHISL